MCSDEWYQVPDGFTYCWNAAGNPDAIGAGQTDDPHGIVLQGPDLHEVTLNGGPAASKIVELKTGPDGYLRHLDDPPTLDGAGKLIVHEVRGHVRYKYRRGSWRA